MVSKRIIPCLDIQNGRTVKGVNFIDLADAGDPIGLAQLYNAQGADELVFLDISATSEKRKTLSALVTRIAQNINIPFTVGGGVGSVQDGETLLQAGADKISVNTAAYKNPMLIEQMALRFGSQCVVLAVDTRFEHNDWFVYLNGGKTPTGIRTLQWVKEAESRGAGEILLTSMNSDGTRQGFACDITRQVSETVGIPVIASGGAGTMLHFHEVFTTGKADAALAASIFHFNEIKIPALKTYLDQQNIPVRIP